MVAGTEAGVRGTAKLLQAEATLGETEELGISTIDTMQQQRESLVRAGDKVDGTNALTEKARSIMQGIQRRATTNKLLLCECRGRQGMGSRAEQRRALSFLLAPRFCLSAHPALLSHFPNLPPHLCSLHHPHPAWAHRCGDLLRLRQGPKEVSLANLQLSCSFNKLTGSPQQAFSGLIPCTAAATVIAPAAGEKLQKACAAISRDSARASVRTAVLRPLN